VAQGREECAKLDLMTNSAKQDTQIGPAETGETESAATAGADADSAADAKAEAAAKPEADDTAEDEAKPDIDDVKAKFREALDRKRQVHAEGQGKGGHESGKVSGAHGPAASRRNFRRKSG
jgi:flagellar motility protein MotE (MotC chaperone)